MDVRAKTIKMIIFFLAVILIGAFLLLYKGNDAVAQALIKKEGIVTAEQVKVAFDSVNGRMIRENVKEAQEVKKGDILMELDSTDVDLSIEKTIAQIAQLDAQIRSMAGTIDIGFSQTDTSDTEKRRAIDQQRAAIDSANASLKNAQLDYGRKAALLSQGAIAKAELDNAEMALNTARANVVQAQQGLNQLLGGAVDTGDTDALTLPSIEETRRTVANKQNDLDSLVAQKQQLETTLKELYVKKDRLTLRAPEDGKILQIIAKQGEMITANTPVILMESKRYYYDIYVSEKQAARMQEGKSLAGHTIADGTKVLGTIRLITQAPGFADLKKTREKGQSDLTAFQIRIYTDPDQGIIPGMTIEVSDDELP